MIIFIKCHNPSAKIFSHLLINFLPPHWDVPLIRLMLEFLDELVELLLAPLIRHRHQHSFKESPKGRKEDNIYFNR